VNIKSVDNPYIVSDIIKETKQRRSVVDGKK